MTKITKPIRGSSETRILPTDFFVFSFLQYPSTPLPRPFSKIIKSNPTKVRTQDKVQGDSHRGAAVPQSPSGKFQELI